MKQFIILLTFLMLNLIGISQQIWFEKTYDFGSAEQGYCVKQTADSGYIVAGRQSIGGFNAKMLLMKTDKYGTLQWSNLVGDGSNDKYAVYITPCITGGYIAVGYLTGLGFVKDIYVVRVNNLGDTLWTKQYGGTTQQEHGTCIQETANHDFVISYYSQDSTGLLKIDSLGNLIWWKKYFIPYGANNGASFYNITVLSAGDYLLSGTTVVAGYGNQGIMMRTDSNGDSIWAKQFGDVNGDQFFEAQETLDGNIIVGGIGEASISSGYLSYVLKLNMNGDTIWTKLINSGYDGCRSIDVCLDGGYILGGTNYVDSSSDMYITKINSIGDSLWTKKYGNLNNETGYFVRQTNDEGYILVGIDGTGNVYLVKTDSAGNTDVGINVLSSASIIFSEYPNPTKDFLNLKTDGKEDYNIYVIDEIGRLLYETKINKSNSNSEGRLDFSEYGNGIYFLKISSAEYSTTKKIIKID